MKKLSLIVLISIALLKVDCLGQNLIERLNNLPATTIQRAPVFDIEKKFLVSLDSINNRLFIQSLARNPRTKEAHDYQHIFEIPLSDLSAGSFLLLKKNENPALLILEIGTTNNKQSIINYFLIEGQIEMVQVRDILSLGSWPYTEQLNSELNEIIKLLSGRISDKSESTNFGGPSRTVFKYFTEKMVIVGKIEPNKELNYGYYYVANLQKPIYYAEKKNLGSSNSALTKDLKIELTRLNGNISNPNPVLINVDTSGKIESIFYLNQRNEVNTNIDLKNFQSFNPGVYDSNPVKTKILLMIR